MDRVCGEEQCAEEDNGRIADDLRGRQEGEKREEKHKRTNEF
jgi:hypothetical protein